MNRVKNIGKEMRVSELRTPKAKGTINEFVGEIDNPRALTLENVDNLRSTAQKLAGNIDAGESAVGMRIIDELDSILDNLPPSAFKGKGANRAANVGERYTVARKLWGRYRRGEMISDMFNKAELQASGFENGIRTNLRQIVNNPKKPDSFQLKSWMP